MGEARGVWVEVGFGWEGGLLSTLSLDAGAGVSDDGEDGVDVLSVICRLFVSPIRVSMDGELSDASRLLRTEPVGLVSSGRERTGLSSPAMTSSDAPVLEPLSFSMNLTSAS